MKLIALEPVHGVQTGQTFEADGADACRLITYGFASPADPGPEEASFGKRTKRRWPEDASLAAELRTRSYVKEVPRSDTPAR